MGSRPKQLHDCRVLATLVAFIFGIGVTLDLRRVPIAVVVEWPSPEADSFLASFRNSRFFQVRFAQAPPER